MSRDLVAGEVKHYKYQLGISDEQYNNKEYLTSKKDDIQAVLNMILKLICENKSQTDILNEVLSSNLVKKICKVNKNSKYTKDDGNEVSLDKKDYKDTECKNDDNKWFNKQNLTAIIKQLIKDNRLKKMCKTHKYVYEYKNLFSNLVLRYPYSYPYYFYYPVGDYIEEKKVSTDNEVKVDLELVGGRDNVYDQLDDLLNALNEEKQQEEVIKLDYYIRLPDKEEKLIDIFIKCDGQDNKLKCKCDKCNKYNVDKQKLMNLLYGDNVVVIEGLLNGGSNNFSDIADYLYTSLYDINTYHLYHNLLSDYKRRK